jgi:hypothetical protein
MRSPTAVTVAGGVTVGLGASKMDVLRSTQ